jgi:emfourin
VKVTLDRSGGLLVTQPPAVISADQLSDAERAHLEELVDAAERACQASPEKPVRGNDMRSYAITVERDGEQRVLRRSDADMVQPYADLKRWIEVTAHATRSQE